MERQTVRKVISTLTICTTDTFHNASDLNTIIFILKAPARICRAFPAKAAANPDTPTDAREKLTLPYLGTPPRLPCRAEIISARGCPATAMI